MLNSRSQNTFTLGFQKTLEMNTRIRFTISHQFTATMMMIASKSVPLIGRRYIICKTSRPLGGILD